MSKMRNRSRAGKSRINATALRSHLKKLKHLKASSSAQRTKLLQKASYLNCVCSCARNIVNGKVPITLRQKNSLSRHREKLTRLLQAKHPESKRKLLRGGFIGSLLSLGLPIIASLVGGLFKKK